MRESHYSGHMRSSMCRVRFINDRPCQPHAPTQTQPLSCGSCLSDRVYVSLVFPPIVLRTNTDEEMGGRCCNIDRLDQQIRDMASRRREKASPAVASPISHGYQGRSATPTVTVSVSVRETGLSQRLSRLYVDGKCMSLNFRVNCNLNFCISFSCGA